MDQIPGGYSGFQMTGMIEWGAKSLDQKLTPPKSHADFPGL